MDRKKEKRYIIPPLREHGAWICSLYSENEIYYVTAYRSVAALVPKPAISKRDIFNYRNKNGSIENY